MAEPAVRRNVAAARILAVREGRARERADRLAAEEPMEIRVAGPRQEPVPVAVTMRTPGGDLELAVGFLYTEGLVRSRAEVVRVSYCRDPGPEEQRFNVVTVDLARPFDPGAVRRNFYATSSCGVCGKAALEDVEVRCAPIPPGFVVPGAVLAELPEALRRGQRVFDQTGGLHAAGLFDAEGRLHALREDVGRHNAVDKLVGEAFLADELPLSERVLQVSGRVSFEIVQKAALAGIPVVAAVSAPSSLAVAAAERLGMTVVGFVRDGRFNVYSHPERVAL
ncbi:MAG TPA: formate dehydrogenase accessory sulfurtransferase FdhD [Actinomycetota bacterium]|nr:formate dehydrogenase accessory sulfurtransferase FdhD [Actinomycetota bacterium]